MSIDLAAKDYKACSRELLKKYENLLKDGIGCIPNTEARLELTTENPPAVYQSTNSGSRDDPGDGQRIGSS